MGEGILKDSVPEAHTDYIIAIISEEYGSIVSIIIIFIFLYISLRIIKNCINQEDQLIKISLCGLASLLIFQTFIHVGVNTSLIPTTGMTLPFLSYGGSSLIGSAILAGVILNYTKIKHICMSKKVKILVAAGGTGGHVFPGSNLATHLCEKKYNVKLVTDKRGNKFLKSFNYLNIIILPSSPLIKKNIFKMFTSTLTIFYSILRSLVFLILNRPTIIFGMGGYASLPLCIAASILRIRFVIYENNLIIGKANKLLLPFAKLILVSFSETEGIPEKYNNKMIKVGNIIKKDIINFTKKNNSNINLKKINLLVLGGSQAAKVFAEILPNIFKKCSDEGIILNIIQHCLPDQTKILILSILTKK